MYSMGYSKNRPIIQIDTISKTVIRKRITNRISDDFITDTRLVPFEIERDTEVNRVKGYVSVKDSGKLMEIAIYNNSLTKVATTELREIPEVGEFEFSLPYTVLKRGTHYYAIATNSIVAKFGINPYFGGLTASNSVPLALTISTTSPVNKVPYSMLVGYDLKPQPLMDYRESHVRVYGVNPDNTQPWGLNTQTFKISMSANSGETFTDMMGMPPAGGDALYDMIVDGGKLYVLTVSLRLFVTNNLLSTATWTEISCPTTSGLRHPQAVARPYGIAKLGSYIFIGEYSGASTGEFAPDGPRILRYDITNGTWALSKEFAGARHVHSFEEQGTVALYVSLGDAGYGNDIGLHRLTPSQIGTGLNGADSWTKWTASGGDYSDHYTVDFILVSSTSFGGTPGGIYGTSDRPKYHLLHAKIIGDVGQFNISPQLFNKPDSPSSETVRSMVLDADKNIYYWTAETTKQALYVTPPPYVQSFKLKDYPQSPKLNLMRSVYSGGYIMMFNQRFKAVSFK